jgi:hypothetical protein
MQTTQSVVAKTAVIDEREPFKLLKRVGSTIYTANVYFSSTTSETLADKILRLARNDGLDFQSEDAQKSLRTGRSRERSAV